VPAFPVDVRIVPTMRVDAASKKVCQGRVVSSSWQTSKVVSSRGRPTFKSSALRGRVTCLATLEAQDLSKLEKYSPLGERYLVTKFEREAKTDGGILLAQTAAENQSKGENLLIGLVHGVPDVEDASKLPKVKVGDKIIFAKYGASEATVEDMPVFFVKATEVLATVE